MTAFLVLLFAALTILYLARRYVIYADLRDFNQGQCDECKFDWQPVDATKTSICYACACRQVWVAKDRA